jgi:capsular exopolysaccharide synthesis family protein
LKKNTEFKGGVDNLIKKVEIKPIVKSRLVNINVTSKNQDLAKEIAQNLAETAIDFSIENRSYLGSDIIDALNSADRNSHQRELLYSLPQVINNDLIKTMKLKEAEFAYSLSNLFAIYTNGHPDVISIKKQLETLNEHISSEINKIIESIKIENSRQFYGNSLRIVDNAYLLKQPFDRKFLVVIIGLFAGFMLGLIFIFFIDFMDFSIKTPKDVTMITKHHFLGSTPYKKDPLSLNESLSSISISINQLLKESNSNSFLVTSALPSEGKTRLSADLAVAFTKIGFRVLVIDSDFRKPSLHKIFNIPNEKGLSYLLSNDNNESSSFENSFYETSTKGLFVIPAGVLCSDISELIYSPKLASFISWAEKNFDRVILDCPATINVADSILYATYINNLIFVIKAKVTNMHIAKRALNILEKTGINIVGIVLTMYEDKKLSKYKAYY